MSDVENHPEALELAKRLLGEIELSRAGKPAAMVEMLAITTLVAAWIKAAFPPAVRAQAIALHTQSMINVVHAELGAGA